MFILFIAIVLGTVLRPVVTWLKRRGIHGTAAVILLYLLLLALLAYWLIGLPYVLVLAFTAGVMEAVPLIGPLLGAIPAALVALTLGPDKLIWVIVATLAIQQLENSILVPRIMRKAVGVNPFVILLALFAFSSLLGIAGALMAIPIAAMIQILLDRLVFQPRITEMDTAAGRNYASRLRYEAQDLAQDLRNQARLVIYHGGDDSIIALATGSVMFEWLEQHG